MRHRARCISSQFNAQFSQDRSKQQVPFDHGETRAGANP